MTFTVDQDAQEFVPFWEREPAKTLKDVRSYMKMDKITPKEKRREKLENVVVFLARWQYSTRSILAYYLGVEERGQTNFFKYLDDSGLVFSKTQFWMPKKGGSKEREAIYGLSSKGLEFARSILGPIKYYVKIERLKYPRFRHHIVSQILFIQEFGSSDHSYDFYGFESESQYKVNFEIVPGVNKVPDFLIVAPGYGVNDKHVARVRTSIEVEITQKYKNKVYDAFRRIYTDIDQGRYRACQFWFEDEKTKKFYETVYREPEWKFGFKPQIDPESGRRTFEATELYPVSDDMRLFEVASRERMRGGASPVCDLDEDYEDFFYAQKITFHVVSIPEKLRKYVEM